MKKQYSEQIIIGPIPPPVGGVSASVLNLQALLKQSEIDFNTFNTSSGSKREDLYKKKSLGQYLRVVETYISFSRFLLSNTRSRICHLFVVSNTAFLRDVGFLLLLKIFRKKVIVHFHSKKKGEFFLGPSMIRLLGWVISFSDKIFVLSDDHKNFFSDYITSSKLKVLENYVDASLLAPNGLKKDEWLYVGRLSRMKGFFEIIEALDLVVNKHGYKNVIINCLGTADTLGNQVLTEQLIKERGLEKNIKLHGVVVGEQKNEFFKNSKGLIFPSRFENSPVVLKEAICSEMAIISSDIEANKVILNRNDCSIYFNVGDAKSLANTILNLENNPQKLNRLMKNSKDAFKFDYRYAKNVVLGVIHEL